MLSERELTLRYLWGEVLIAVEADEMDRARICETFFSAVEDMTDGEYVTDCCAETEKAPT